MSWLKYLLAGSEFRPSDNKCVWTIVPADISDAIVLYLIDLQLSKHHRLPSISPLFARTKRDINKLVSRLTIGSGSVQFVGSNSFPHEWYLSFLSPLLYNQQS